MLQWIWRVISWGPFRGPLVPSKTRCFAGPPGLSEGPGPLGTPRNSTTGPVIPTPSQPFNPVPSTFMWIYYTTMHDHNKVVPALMQTQRQSWSHSSYHLISVLVSRLECHQKKMHIINYYHVYISQTNINTTQQYRSYKFNRRIHHYSVHVYIHHCTQNRSDQKQQSLKHKTRSFYCSTHVHCRQWNDKTELTVLIALPLVAVHCC